MKTFVYGLSLEELEKRTHKDYLTTKKLLGVNEKGENCKEYESLADGDKAALKYLVKVAYILDEIYLKQDNQNNIYFREFLKEEIKKGNKQAELTMKLFLAQKGIHAVDTEANKISLIKDDIEKPGKAFYPCDLEEKEFHQILIKMLKEGKTEEVKTILNQRSIVKRDNEELIGVDYTEEFKEEFQKAAELLEKAAEVSTNDEFNKYLKLQALALIENNPMADAYADKKWAELQDTPLEFTITRENYEDELTGTVVENEELNTLLKEKNITPVGKDALGFRVGIVNKEGTEKLLEIKKYLPELAKIMPFAEEYQQNISTNSEETKQSMVDVDLVAVCGDVGAFRGGITLAENLPNDDKLSLTIGGGRRNVYHRQIRFVSDWEKLQKRLDATLEKDFHQFYENEADHWFTIGHENAHSLGPKEGTEALGKYKHIIEENKADMASLALLDKLVELGMYNDFQKKQIIVTFIADNFLKAKPNMNQAHRVRSVMQMYYLIKNDVVKISDEGFVSVNIEKAIPVARQMLEEIIRIQLSGDYNLAEKYINENFVWTDGMEKIAQKIREINKTLNGTVEAKLAEKILEK